MGESLSFQTHPIRDVDERKAPLRYSPASPVDCRQTPAGRRLLLIVHAGAGPAAHTLSSEYMIAYLQIVRKIKMDKSTLLNLTTA